MGEAATKEYMAQRSARKTRRVWLPILLFGACFAVLLGRLVHIQVINHDNYSVQAENTLIGNDILEAPRGKIFDRNGQPLVLSIDTWDLYISTRAWSVNETAKQAAKTIAHETGLDDKKLQLLVHESSLVDQVVARDLSYETGLKLMELAPLGAVLLPSLRIPVPAAIPVPKNAPSFFRKSLLPLSKPPSLNAALPPSAMSCLLILKVGSFCNLSKVLSAASNMSL